MTWRELLNLIQTMNEKELDKKVSVMTGKEELFDLVGPIYLSRNKSETMLLEISQSKGYEI